MGRYRDKRLLTCFFSGIENRMLAYKEKDVFSSGQLEALVASLREGGVIAFPTETVYALAGDARNVSTLKKIFKLKNRPLNQPLSVLLAQNYDLNAWADEISPVAKQLADYFWPGPLTLILNKNESIARELTGGHAKIGLRVPDHPLAQAILKAFDGGLAAPSANRSNHFSPTHVEHVRQAFGEQLDGILDGGACSIGIESTIVDVSSTIPKLLRLGAIAQEKIQRVIHCELIMDPSASTRRSSLIFQQIQTDELKKVVFGYINQGKSVTVLARHPSMLNHKNLLWITMPKEAPDYAHVLYKHLREAEQNSSDKILVESVATSEAWSGIRRILG